MSLQNLSPFELEYSDFTKIIEYSILDEESTEILLKISDFLYRNNDIFSDFSRYLSVYLKLSPKIVNLLFELNITSKLTEIASHPHVAMYTTERRTQLLLDSLTTLLSEFTIHLKYPQVDRITNAYVEYFKLFINLQNQY